MKIIPKLSDLREMIGKELGFGNFVISPINIDDAFKVLKSKGVNEIKVNWNEMLTIALFVVANIQNNSKPTHWDALQILREGKIDKFLGVKLILYERTDTR